MSLLPDNIYDRMSFGLIAFFGLIILGIFPNYGMSWDAPVHDHGGQLAVEYYKALLQGQPFDMNQFNQFNIFLYGTLFDTTAALLNIISPFDHFDTRHLLGGLFGLLGVIGCGLLTRRLAGPEAALGAMVLLILTPAYFGHMFHNPKDLPFAVGYIWSLYYMVIAAEHFPRIPNAVALKLGLAVGAALAIRIGGLLLLCYLAMFMGIYLLWTLIYNRKEAVSAAGHLSLSFGIVTVTGYSLMLLFWPWVHAEPLARPLETLSKFSQFSEGPATILFNGEYINTVETPAYYLPLNLMVKIPELTLILLFCGSLFGLFHLIKHKSNVIHQSKTGMMLFAMFFPILYIIVTGATVYDGIRHILFVVPLLCVFAGISGAYMLKILAAYNRRYMKIAGLGAAVYLLYLAGTLAYLHPYEYVYFNQFTGGTKGAEERFEIDYWATSYREAADRLVFYLNQGARKAGDTYKVGVCYNAPQIAYYLPPYITLTNDINQADFFIGLARGECHKMIKIDDLFRVERFGVPLTVVKDLAPLRSTEN